MKKQLKLGLLVFILFVCTNPLMVYAIEETDRYMLIPGGDAVGIHIETAGLIVVDTYTVETECGEYSPAAAAGLTKGDVITAINGQPINDIEDYKDALIAREGFLVLSVNQGGTESEVTITGCRNMDGDLTTGVYLRNKVAGIGTLTYVDPGSLKYAALGHEIIDQDTNRIVDIRNGQLTNSKITSIRKATSDDPGQKIAEISFDSPHGSIDKNNQYGIFGQMDTEYFKSKKMLPIAYQNEIKLGHATILTVIDGKEIQEFVIEIIDINPQATQEIKGIKYVVTDETLLEKTGGIVQGMSGSPIVQDGKIIGAVTHVLVHDSTVGYGVFIEWMLAESEIDYRNGNVPAIQAFRPAA